MPGDMGSKCGQGACKIPRESVKKIMFGGKKGILTYLKGFGHMLLFLEA